jgi:NAD(P)-dependent dehydrogenase (short-subunit alcohol dehydrogenase family)
VVGKEGSTARLAGKTAFVTGAGSGIDRATAIRFAREGAKVAIAEINVTAGEETAHLAGNARGDNLLTKTRGGSTAL